MANRTNLTGANNLAEMIVALDAVANGWVSILILSTVFFISLISMKKFEGDFIASFTTSATITTVVALVAFFGEIITWKILIFPIILMIMGLIMHMLSKD